MHRTRRLVIASAALAVGAVVLITARMLPFGVDFDPVTFDTRHLPATPTEDDSVLLRRWEPVATPVAHPEDIVADPTGTLYVGVIDGKILRLGPDDAEWSTFADTGGRPLGLSFDGDGNLLVANHGIGVQRIARDGTVTLLADSVNGEPIYLPNGVVSAADGTIYVSDSSIRYNRATIGVQPSYTLPDLLEGRPYGRIVRIDPASGETTIVADGLYFPNSLVISPDRRALIVGESSRYRVTRIWLEGPRRGEVDHVITDLPGMPDGLDYDDEGRLLLALYDHAPALNRWILPYKTPRRILMSLPRSWFVNDSLTGFVAVIDPETWAIENMIRAEEGAFTPSNVVQVGDRLFAGTLVGRSVAVTSNP